MNEFTGLNFAQYKLAAERVGRHRLIRTLEETQDELRLVRNQRDNFERLWINEHQRRVKAEQEMEEMDSRVEHLAGSLAESFSPDYEVIHEGGS